MTAVIPAAIATSEILNEFKELVDVNVEYTITELKKILSDVYKSKTAGAKAAKKTKTVKSDKSDSDDNSDDDVKSKKTVKKSPKLDKDGNEKDKRKPTAYNTYIKKRIAELKEEKPDTPPKEFMTIAASGWKTLTQDEKDSYK